MAAMAGGGGSAAGGDGIDAAFESMMERIAECAKMPFWRWGGLADGKKGLAAMDTQGIWGKDTQGLFKPTKGLISMPKGCTVASAPQDSLGGLSAPSFSSSSSGGHYEGIG